jgi:uncharacterized protein (DUF1501 family)
MMHRRHFLQSSAAWASMLAMGQAGSQTATDYKALVCVFLYGGNDSFNTVLATDPDSWAAYQAVRNQQPSPIALKAPGTAPVAGATAGSPEALGGVLALSPVVGVPGRSFALHPKLPLLAGLFNTDRRLAVLANVGPLIQPTTKADYLLLDRGQLPASGAKLPSKLFSHNDQQTTWQSLRPEGSATGWGGQLVDAFDGSRNRNSLYASVSVGSNAVWLTGQQVKQYQLAPTGAIQMGGTHVYGSPKVAEAVRRIASNGLVPGAGGTAQARAQHVLMADLGAVAERSIVAETALSTALAPYPAANAPFGPDTQLKYTNLAGEATYNALAGQLQMVARMIAARASLGVGRQVFFVQMSGFDLHDNQNSNHAELMGKLDHALAYFDQTLRNMPGGDMSSQVTTFTASDFGRTFTSNGDGTDHGWGAHHFILGGAVRGGRIHGTFPRLVNKNTSDNHFASDDLLLNGVMLPTTSVDQMGATLANWFGVSNPDAIFTNLKNFPVKDLGFMS